MHVHEYQAKGLLKKYGIDVQFFAIVSTVRELKDAIDKMDLKEAVLKIQVHAGGRGKAGGVKIARNHTDILSHGKRMLGMKIVNEQTGPEGIVAHQLMVSPLIEIKREFYVGAVIDRRHAQAMLILSPEGGMDIEEIAHRFPEKILKLPISLQGTLRSYQLLQAVKFMGWKNETAQAGKKILMAVAKAFVENDALLLEINPLVETLEGSLVALDAKFTVDDNALYRQPELAALYDPTQIPQNEADAKKFDLAYVTLDGDIGCMVNGAGLAMATMDIIEYYGGRPANFLDVGGSATQDKVAEGFRLILSDPHVKVIFVNIFGGIMNCVTIAAGIVAAAGDLNIPLVVRMEGNNVVQGKQMVAASGLNIIIADSLAEGAKKAVEIAKQAPTRK